jgi:hypothetical protein
MTKPFHPLTFWGLFTALAVGVIASDSVLYAILAVGGAAIVVRLRPEEGPWRNSFKWSLAAGAILILIRALTGVVIGVPRIGRTILKLPPI